MTMMMKMTGGAIVATWIVYLTALTALSLAGVTVDRTALHAALVLLLTTATLAYVAAALGDWLRRTLTEAWTPEHRGGPDLSPAYMGEAAELFELGKKAGQQQ